MRSALPLIIAIFGLGYASSAQIINIPSDQPTIQSGINVAEHGDTLLIANGRYFENINFKGKAILIASHYILYGDTTHISRTIIDGGRPVNPDSASVVYLVSGEDSTSVLCGLTITGGTGTVTEVEDPNSRAGGGVFVHHSGCRLSNNIITGNRIEVRGRSIYGAGIYANISTTCIIENNLITLNSLESRYMIDGPGMTISAGKTGFISIKANKITRNHGRSKWINNAHGGGITLVTAIPSECAFEVSGNLISENELYGENNRVYGAGMHILCIEKEGSYIDLNPQPVVRNNIIAENYSQGVGGGIAICYTMKHSASSIVSPRPIIINNTIENNRAENGAGIYVRSGMPVLIDNVLKNDLSHAGSQEILSIGNNLVYLFKNQVKEKIPGRRIIGLFRRYYLKSDDNYFKIKSSAQTGVFRTYQLPPLWRSRIGLILYGIIIVSLFLGYRRFLLYQTRLKTALEIERIEKEKVREVEQIRSRFFTNISHEFRTPLTLLNGPLNDLLNERPDLKREDRTLFRMMKGNVDRLYRLINQLLDLSKLETGNVKLQVSEGDFDEFINRIIQSFLSLAESRGIKYEYKLEDSTAPVYFDADKIEKILTNLISNAFKYTPEDGRIEVLMNYTGQNENTNPDFAEIIVSDSGKGIPDDQIDKIFERFFQVSTPDNSNPERNGEVEGTGIGLALTKELVELYRGNIRVESEAGRGSTFTLLLPVAKSQFTMEEIVVLSGQESAIPEIRQDVKEFREPENGQISEEAARDEVAGDEAEATVLIVEDNIELRKYTSRILLDSFQVLEAENGKAGIDNAIKIVPDLVISDLMMPGMDGMDMCKHLKADERTSHIPIIMLTAKADSSSKLEGLKTGADDYITKPFDKKELLARVTNLIEQRKKLRDRYRKEFLTGCEDIDLAPPDDRFLEKVAETIRVHLQETEFNIENLSHEIGMSRSQLYRKILAITGFTPVEYLRNMKLKHAARLFREKHKNIAQVAYHVGFSNPSHFSKSFRKLYGSSPKEYIAQHQ